MNRAPAKLGTFLGVFTPTILTILGVIMYMRTGWLTGNFGLVQILIIVVLANSITLITTFSFSSVATNGKVGAGGAYFIISRSLGLEIGAAIGIPLFLSQATSVTLYSFGLAESFRIIWPGVPVQAAAFIIIIIVAWLSWKGAEFALKSQIPLMVLVGVSLVMLVIGAFVHYSDNPRNLLFPATGDVPFWTGFAVFFPAVTGIMAGLGLSGDLKDPQKSIPRGAILACLVGFAIYLIVPFLLVIGTSPEQLRDNTMVWGKIAPLGMVFILPGLLGAIFSSAVGSMLAAPRTLLALSEDQLTGTKTRNLIKDSRGVNFSFVITVCIGLAAVFIGDLNSVAPVVSMFFLTVYGAINLVAALETLSNEPSWRPLFSIPWLVSMLGAVACLGVMLLISPLASLVAIIIEVGLYFLFVRHGQKLEHGDARRGVYEALIRRSLLKLRYHPMTPRNWRPHILVFVNNPEEEIPIIRFADWFSVSKGIVSVSYLVVGDVLDESLSSFSIKKRMESLMTRENMLVFPEVHIVRNLVDGIIDTAQANGMAGFESNTVMISWPDSVESLASCLIIMRKLARLKKSLVIGRVKRDFRPSEKDRPVIHVWWGGLQRNGDMLLLFAHLLKLNPVWRKAVISVISIENDPAAAAQKKKALESLISDARILAQPVVLPPAEGKSVRDIIHQYSKKADVVFLGLNMPDMGDEHAYAQNITDLAGSFSRVFFVKNSSIFTGELLGSSKSSKTAG